MSKLSNLLITSSQHQNLIHEIIDYLYTWQVSWLIPISNGLPVNQ